MTYNVFSGTLNLTQLKAKASTRDSSFVSRQARTKTKDNIVMIGCPIAPTLLLLWMRL